jgi:transposase
MAKNAPDKVGEPQEAIKRLLIFQLYLAGASTKDIGELLGVSYKTIERIIPSNAKKRGNKVS